MIGILLIAILLSSGYLLYPTKWPEEIKEIRCPTCFASILHIGLRYENGVFSNFCLICKEEWPYVDKRRKVDG